MLRPPRIPERGDVSVPLVANLLGVSPDEFALSRSELERGGFPEPDPTTGPYCMYRSCRSMSIAPVSEAFP